MSEATNKVWMCVCVWWEIVLFYILYLVRKCMLIQKHKDRVRDSVRNGRRNVYYQLDVFVIFFWRDSMFIVVCFVFSEHPRAHQFYALACSLTSSPATMLHRSFHWTIKIIKMRYYACTIMQRVEKKKTKQTTTTTQNKSRSNTSPVPFTSYENKICMLVASVTYACIVPCSISPRAIIILFIYYYFFTSPPPGVC